MQHPFIFSNETKYRLQRHLSFWIFWWLFLSFLYIFVPIDNSLSVAERLPSSAVDCLLYLSSHVFLSYTLMYFVIPKYIVKSKYTLAAVWSLILIVLTATIAALITMYLVIPVNKFLLPTQFIVKPTPAQAQTNTIFNLAFIAGLRGGLTVGGIAAAIKLMKHWYMQGQKNLQLKKENVEAQLEVLKAQVHPHFLFNTLNNIYSFTQNTSPVA